MHASCQNVRHPRNGSRKAIDGYCPGCSDSDFFKKIIRDYPLKNGLTLGIVVSETAGYLKALRINTTACDWIAPGADGPCSCGDCPARNCASFSSRAEDINEQLLGHGERLKEIRNRGYKLTELGLKLEKNDRIE